MAPQFEKRRLSCCQLVQHSFWRPLRGVHEHQIVRAICTGGGRKPATSRANRTAIRPLLRSDTSWSARGRERDNRHFLDAFIVAFVRVRGRTFLTVTEPSLVRYRIVITGGMSRVIAGVAGAGAVDHGRGRGARALVEGGGPLLVALCARCRPVGRSDAGRSARRRHGQQLVARAGTRCLASAPRTGRLAVTVAVDPGRRRNQSADHCSSRPTSIGANVAATWTTGTSTEWAMRDGRSRRSHFDR